MIDLIIADRRSDLDSFATIAQLARRLTGKLRERYENQLHKYKSKNDKRPGIQWFRDLLEDYARKLRQKLAEASEKVEGHDKQDTKGATSKTTTAKNQSPVRKGKAIGCASVSGWSQRTNTNKQNCSLCGEQHPLYACWEFRNMSVAERWDATKRAQACYICL